MAFDRALAPLADAGNRPALTAAGDALADLVASADADVRRAALRLLKALAALRWGAAGLAASEGVLELLLAAPRHPLDLADPRAVHEADLVESEAPCAPGVGPGDGRSRPVVGQREVDDPVG